MVSIVIPAYNEAGEIAQCLNSLVQQKTERKFEVIVVDNASTDNTVKVVESFATQLHLRVVFEPQKGRGAARAAGFGAAHGNIILSTDADTIVPNDWVENLATALEMGNEVAVVGSTTVNGCGRFVTAIFNFIQPVSARIYRVLFGHYWLAGFNFGIKRETYFRAGGFNVNLTAMEDTDLGFRVKKIGKIKFLSNVSVAFSGRRFQNRFWAGMKDYVVQFLYYYFGKEEKVKLSDIRV